MHEITEFTARKKCRARKDQTEKQIELIIVDYVDSSSHFPIHLKSFSSYSILI